MVGVEINGHNFLWLVDEIVQYVAATAGDGQQFRMASQIECGCIYSGIFPDLVVDESLKPERKHPFKYAPLRSNTVVMNGLVQV